MSPIVMLLADLLVAILLVATVITSMRLSRRITRLKADEAAMRQTIGELVIASETAERAIAGLRTTLGDCDRTLAERLRTAERYAADLAEQVEAGETVMARIMKIVDSSRQAAGIPATPASAPVEAPAPAAFTPPPMPVSERISAAAQALAERTARRLEARGTAA